MRVTKQESLVQWVVALIRREYAGWAYGGRAYEALGLVAFMALITFLARP